MKRPLVVALAVAALAVGASGCSTVDPDAATVNGDEINRRDFEDELQELSENEQFVSNAVEPVEGDLAGTVTTGFAASELTNRIMATLISQELEARRLTVDAAIADAARQYAPQYVLGAAEGVDEAYQELPSAYRATVEDEMAERFTLGLDVNGLTSGELPGYIQDQGARYAQQVCVLVVPAATEEDASAALAALEGGAEFADVVTQYAAQPGLVGEGGELRLQDGSCPSGADLATLGEEFISGISAAEVGTDVGPLPAGQFFVVVRVESVEGVDETATSQVLFELSSPDNEAFGEWMTTAADAAEVDIDPRYGSWDASLPAVVSPDRATASTSVG